MKTRFGPSTRYPSSCIKILLLGLALLLALLCAWFCPANAQSQQAMVKNQPFPYPSGVAIDTVLYKSIRAKLEAAVHLRTNAQVTITKLQHEIQAAQSALDAHKSLVTHDGRTLDSLARVSADLNVQLTTAQDAVKAADGVISQVVKELPRQARKSLQNATPDQLATAIVDYITTLQARKWKWAGCSALLSGTLTLLALLLH